MPFLPPNQQHQSTEGQIKDIIIVYMYIYVVVFAVYWQVRWADIEERKDQMRRRELGFVIGQTDWAKMTDDSYADRALNRTKYI